MIFNNSNTHHIWTLFLYSTILLAIISSISFFGWHIIDLQTGLQYVDCNTVTVSHRTEQCEITIDRVNGLNNGECKPYGSED
jgi:hypothetical protein